ncbi:MAG TPA: hypothetical protein VHS58_06525 [Acetobacteraceae bacterium]|jgi:chaperone modulatory protein CbpM|nr:hypothetical protein [Acetobacteraceae bacterium]
MMRIAAVVAVVGGIGEPDLRDWIARGWVAPEPFPPEDFVFAEIDVARIRLIRDLRVAMGVEVETVPLVLDLLDQVYTLRRTLRAVTAVLDAEPEDVRRRIWAALRE